MVRIIGQRQMNRVVSRHVDVQNVVRREAREVENRAKSNLRKVRASTTHSKIFGPGHLTFISSRSEGPDVLVTMNAPNPIAIEFGHSPSGVFAGTPTKSPDPTYILSRAAYLL